MQANYPRYESCDECECECDLGDQLLLWPVSVVSVSVSSSGVLTQGGGRPEPEQRRINQSPLSVTISAAWASSDQSLHRNTASRHCETQGEWDKYSDHLWPPTDLINI